MLGMDCSGCCVKSRLKIGDRVQTGRPVRTMGAIQVAGDSRWPCSSSPSVTKRNGQILDIFEPKGLLDGLNIRENVREKGEKEDDSKMLTSPTWRTQLSSTETRKNAAAPHF